MNGSAFLNQISERKNPQVIKRSNIKHSFLLVTCQSYSCNVQHWATALPGLHPALGPERLDVFIQELFKELICRLSLCLHQVKALHLDTHYVTQ